MTAASPLSESFGRMFGIALTSEALSSDRTRDTCLGAVVFPSTAGLTDLRNHLIIHLPDVPPEFCFLSSKGWQLTKVQESTLQVEDVVTDNETIRIQRTFDKPRVGLKVLNGPSVGFVFIDHSSSVSLLREEVENQLGTISSSDNQGYEFLDRNAWPIRKRQETSVNVIDILTNGCATVVVRTFSPPTRMSRGSSHGSISGSQERPAARRKSRLSSQPQLTFTCKDRDRPRSIDMTDNGYDPKQVLISYARTEAAHHARRLKFELVELGFSVYLDVHEIKSGTDWQDSLNDAVSNCEVFVPLITSRYGETQWTNREIKLADFLGKDVIPINFLDHWPPRRLAIQFSTTQYIPWKTLDVIRQEKERGDGDKVWDLRTWTDDCVREAAYKISEKIQLSERQLDVTADLEEADVLDAAKPPPLKRKRTSSLINFDGPLMMSQKSMNGNIAFDVVISIHPAQHLFGMELKALLKNQGYNVWCSSESREASVPNGESDLFDHDGMNHSAALGVTEASKYPLTQVLSTDSNCANDFCLSQPLVDNEPNGKEQQKIFQEKADDAGVIIVVLSKAFARSPISQQQVFYCEHRKRVIPLRYEVAYMPTWLSMLIGTGIIEDVKSKNYQDSLLKRVKRALDPNSTNSEMCEVDENYIASQVKLLKETLPKQLCVYIAGSAKFFFPRSEEICEKLGEKLAEIDNLLLVTGGFSGAGDTVARNYNRKTIESQKPCSTWHVLPEKDDKDLSHQAKQRTDKTFEPVSYGKTVFSGNSVREREMIAARVFDICVLIEGGSGAAHEAEQFIWNDHVVIPVKCTGGAAGGKFNVPQQIFEIPVGVAKNDWEILEDKSATSDDQADAVVRIIQVVRERLKLDSPSPMYTGLKVPPMRKTSTFKRKPSDLCRMNTFLLKSPPTGSKPNHK